jgi:predicted TIM-barrel fold metal-dependent hydrolase
MLLQDKAMFGSDWPAIGVERWLEEFQQVNVKPEVRKKIMLDNAKKFFALEF